MCYIFKVEEGSFGDLIYVFLKRLVVVKKTPVLQLCGEGERSELSMVRQKLWVVLMRDFGPMMTVSDLSWCS